MGERNFRMIENMGILAASSLVYSLQAIPVPSEARLQADEIIR